jgi:hypothetical protein
VAFTSALLDHLATVVKRRSQARLTGEEPTGALVKQHADVELITVSLDNRDTLSNNGGRRRNLNGAELAIIPIEQLRVD